MKLAFSTLACPNWSWEHALEAAQQYGYEGLEIRLLDGEILPADLGRVTRRRVREACRTAGLPIISVGTSLCIAQPEPDDRESQIQEGMAFLELAVEWDAPSIRVFGYPPDGLGEAQAEQAAVACLQLLAERAKELGVTVALETHDAFSSVASVARILGQVGGSGVGLIWDIMNTYSAGESVADSMRQLRPYLTHVHVKDGRRPADGGKEWQSCLLGQGDVPIHPAMVALHKAGYNGWFSVEWEKKWQPHIEEPEVALPQYAMQLRSYLAALKL